MKPSLGIFVFLFFLALTGLAQVKPNARVVNSEEDKVRLEGWEAHQALQQRLDAQRLSDQRNIQKSRDNWEALKNKNLIDYRAAKKREKAALDESSPEFKEDLRIRAEDLARTEKRRKDYVQRRDEIRRASRSAVKLTEETELALDQDLPRIAWEKRNLFGEKAKGKVAGGSSSSGPSGRSGGNSGGGSDYIPPAFDQAPPPMPTTPPAEYFEPDIPPPPPPGLPDGGFDPAPPAMDDIAPPPPPVFDDEF